MKIMIETRLILVRHGETEWNVTGRLNATTDLPLTPKGKEELLPLQRELAYLEINRVFSSPLTRALETATLICPDKKVELDIRLVEVNFGPFEGKTPKELSQGELAQAFTLWRKEDHPIIPDGAEDFHDAARRAKDFMEDVRTLDGTILVVSHGVFIRILLCSCVLGINSGFHRRLRVDNGKISVVTWENEGIRLTKLNSSTIT
jgi:broad specificity phosphatase PhoE